MQHIRDAQDVHLTYGHIDSSGLPLAPPFLPEHQQEEHSDKELEAEEEEREEEGKERKEGKEEEERRATAAKMV